MRYIVILEKGENSFGAYVPDLPGCVAIGETREEVLTLIYEAIEFHIEGLLEDGLPIPTPCQAANMLKFLRHERKITIQAIELIRQTIKYGTEIY